MAELLALAVIRTDAGCQPRSGIFDEVVADYRQHLERGGDLPPVDVFYDGAEYYLADGYHRFAAHDLQDLKSISAEVHQGTLRDAILYSLGANQTHGLRRSNEDKRRAVERMLSDDEWSNWSDGKIAEHVGVSQPFVRGFRKKLKPPTNNGYKSDGADKRVGRDGRARPISRKPSGPTRTTEYSQADEYEDPTRQVEEFPQRDAALAGGEWVAGIRPDAVEDPPQTAKGEDSAVIKSDGIVDFASALAIAMSVSRELYPRDVVMGYPKSMLPPADELRNFTNWMLSFEDEIANEALQSHTAA